MWSLTDGHCLQHTEAILGGARVRQAKLSPNEMHLICSGDCNQLRFIDIGTLEVRIR
jgi:hypothetical protein